MRLPLVLILAAAPALAEIDASVRPPARPAPAPASEPAPPAPLSAAVRDAVARAQQPAGSDAPPAAPPRPGEGAAPASAGVATIATAAPARDTGTAPARPAPAAVPPAGPADLSNGGQPALDAWIAAFRPRALAAGIEPATFDAALSDVPFDPRIITRDRNQTEFTKTIWDYLDTAVSDARIANGRAAMERHAGALAAAEAEHGVDRHVVAAIWGLESAYGGFRGTDSTIASLAILAADPRRSAFFEDQLLAALRILQAGEVAPGGMRGSWAGAMGHTQFMPTSFLRYAVDADGDGRRDVWGDDPADALASTARYLAAHGWTTGQPWGVEVTLPEGFDFTEARRDNPRAPAEWQAMGVRAADGAPIPDHGPATILLPAGHQGAAFMIWPNFAALEAYNTADAYVIGVGHLADRLRGGPAFAGGWPRADRALTGDERRELQRRLTERGFDPGGVDGRIGPLTVGAVRDWQLAEGRVPDGYASPAVLDALRQ
ncbi:membrane-bound lytic murein transglycosylase B [Hasllibacter halocynthiae]|uniref:Membrane-bound lytic murein transglycosylase B n=1 Tax=Hasllibacter halocynthiae TaxID=595589 RepID=A0A2T0X1N5_9RHOB|nr:lytic murein transglycosylase [Hasllibacter halocynthiae]PRY92851.1 membrane-bound lytic murein transglycosylase B [Hasllibacter halocynthiae]